MYYSATERINIGKQVFKHTLSKTEAAKEYDVTEVQIIQCVKDYLKSEGIAIIPKIEESLESSTKDYSEMTREELITEVMRKDIEVARAKKGYLVKGGGGKEKEFNTLNDANTK